MSGNSVQGHYAGDDTGSAMAGRILAAVRAVYGHDAAITPETLAPLDHFNSRGLAATQELATLLDPQADESMLDIGSGIGGPARWIARTNPGMPRRCTSGFQPVAVPVARSSEADFSGLL